MAQIIIKEYGNKIFQRDFNRTEENLIGLIKDMSIKGIISLSEFKRLFDESISETINVYHDSLDEMADDLTNKIIRR